VGNLIHESKFHMVNGSCDQTKTVKINTDNQRITQSAQPTKIKQ